LICRDCPKFFDGFKALALEAKIFSYLERYADFDFKIDYEKWIITFSCDDANHIKVSRGEENISAIQSILVPSTNQSVVEY